MRPIYLNCDKVLTQYRYAVASTLLTPGIKPLLPWGPLVFADRSGSSTAAASAATRNARASWSWKSSSACFKLIPTAGPLNEVVLNEFASTDLPCTEAMLGLGDTEFSVLALDVLESTWDSTSNFYFSSWLQTDLQVPKDICTLFFLFKLLRLNKHSKNIPICTTYIQDSFAAPESLLPPTPPYPKNYFEPPKLHTTKLMILVHWEYDCHYSRFMRTPLSVAALKPQFLYHSNTNPVFSNDMPSASIQPRAAPFTLFSTISTKSDLQVRVGAYYSPLQGNTCPVQDIVMPWQGHKLQTKGIGCDEPTRCCSRHPPYRGSTRAR